MRPIPDWRTCRRRRYALYDSVLDTLSALHRVEPDAVGLSDFGRPSGYVQRQYKAWSSAYRATESRALPSMDALMEWLPAHFPETDETAIVHGDYRFGNLLLDPAANRVVAVLDWELSTLGHPLSDLGYFCTPFFLPNGLRCARGRGLDLEAASSPDLNWVVDRYCALTGRTVCRTSGSTSRSICFASRQSCRVYARARAGNAANDDAKAVGERAVLWRNGLGCSP